MDDSYVVKKTRLVSSLVVHFLKFASVTHLKCLILKACPTDASYFVAYPYFIYF